jgi:hypothetical protein
MAKRVRTTKMPSGKVEELRSVRLELPESLQREFRVEAAKENKSMALVARQLVEAWLEKRRKGAGR